VFRPPPPPSLLLSLFRLPVSRYPRRLRPPLAGVATHARVSTGSLPRPQTIIAIPRADTKGGCHFSAFFLRSPNVGDGRDGKSGAAKIEASSRTHPRRILAKRHTRARTHAPTSLGEESSALPPLSAPSRCRVVRCFSRDHLAANFTRAATRRLTSSPGVARRACLSGRRSRSRSRRTVASKTHLRPRFSFCRTVAKTSIAVEAAVSLRAHAGIDCHSRAPRFAQFRGRPFATSFATQSAR